MKYYWLIYLLIVGNITAFAQLIKVNSDTWSATDALGRKVCEYQDVGEKKKDKYVAMFYWTWHQGVDDTTYTVKNISEIVIRGNTKSKTNYTYDIDIQQIKEDRKKYEKSQCFPFASHFGLKRG